MYLKCNLWYTAGALDVESEDPQSQVILIFHILLARVELLPFVDVLPAVITSVIRETQVSYHTAGQSIQKTHVSYILWQPYRFECQRIYQIAQLVESWLERFRGLRFESWSGRHYFSHFVTLNRKPPIIRMQEIFTGSGEPRRRVYFSPQICTQSLWFYK